MGSRARRVALGIAIAALVLPASTLTAYRYVPSPGNQYDPAIAFDGTNYFVVWRDDYRGADIHGARVTQQGVVLDEDSIPIWSASGFQGAPAIAFDGQNYLAVWEDIVGTEYTIRGSRVTPEGTVLDPNGISIATTSGVEPAVAFDGENYLVVWRDMRTAAWRIYGARVTPQGTVLDPNGFSISAPAIDPRSAPSVSFGGTQYLVTWDQYSGLTSDLYGARVTPQGAVLDPNGIAISTAINDQQASSVAYDGVNFLVAWADERASSFVPDIFAARVTAAGTLLDLAGIMIATRSNAEAEPALGFDHENYLAAWSDSFYPFGDVYGARVTPGGNVLDPSPFPISDIVNQQSSSAIAFGEVSYFVVWEDGRTQGLFDIQGSRVTRAGVVLDPNGIVISRSTTGPPPPPPGPPPPPPPPPVEPPPPQPPPGPPPPPPPPAPPPPLPPPPPPPPPVPPPPPPPPPIEPPPPFVCDVPRVIGLTVARARTFLRQNHCSVGSVRRVHVKRALRGKVVAQRPSRGTRRANGFPVRLTVGRR